MKDPKIVDKKVIEIDDFLLEKQVDVVALACTIIGAYFTGNVPSKLLKIIFLNCNTCAFKYLEC